NAQSQRLRAACASNFRQTCRHAQADSQIDIAARRGISHSGRSTLGMDRRRRHAEYRFNHGAARFWADAFNIVERKESEDRVIDASIAKRLYNGSPPKNHSARLTSESPRPRPETHRRTMNMPIADVNGCKLYYEANGTGPEVVLIHGEDHGIEMFEQQV